VGSTVSIVLTINREQFILRDAETISRIRTELEEAVRAGGRMVVVGDAGQAPEVLVTPSTPVRIDLLPGADAHDAGSTDFLDFDEYRSR
jgi:hypothetical protein